jgi:predicted ArsR family transcriptional regulator
MQQAILLILAGVESMLAEEIAKRLGVGQHVAEYHLDKLYQAGMISAEFATFGAPVCWELMTPGRDYLVERGLVK